MTTSPFTEPQKRSRRIRRNCGSWNPLVDLHEIYAGHRSTDRQGVFDLFDAPVGVARRVEPVARSEPLLEAEMSWEADGSVNPLFIWKTDDGFHMLYESESGTCCRTGTGPFPTGRSRSCTTHERNSQATSSPIIESHKSDMPSGVHTAFSDRSRSGGTAHDTDHLQTGGPVAVELSLRNWWLDRRRALAQDTQQNATRSRAGRRIQFRGMRSLDG